MLQQPAERKDGDDDYDDIDDESFDDDHTDTSDDTSEDSYDFDRDAPLYEYIDSLIPKTPPDGGPKAKAKWETNAIAKKVVERKTTIFERLWTSFQDWRRKERTRRMHGIYSEYEKRVAKYDQIIRREIEHEIKDDEEAVRIEVKRIEARIKSNSTVKTSTATNLIKSDEQIRFDKVYAEREKETMKIDFYFLNLQKWAVEKYGEEDKILLELERTKAEREEKEQIQRQKEYRLAKMKEDAVIYEEDYHITQDVMKEMRKTGVVAGVNPYDRNSNNDDRLRSLNSAVSPNQKMKKKKKKGGRGISLEQQEARQALKDSSNQAIMRIALREDLNYKSQTKLLGKDYITPFNRNLAARETTQVKYLKATSIGERGALCLGAEFIRGACSSLQVLDLSRCEIKTRGFGRLLQGIRIGNLYQLQGLILRGNHIGPRGLEYLKDIFQSNVLSALNTLDLRENELGDDGADTIMRMIIADYFRSISYLYLQNNFISDIGCTKIVKAMISLKDRKFANVKRIALESNLVSSKCKADLAPIPLYISV